MPPTSLSLRDLRREKLKRQERKHHNLSNDIQQQYYYYHRNNHFENGDPNFIDEVVEVNEENIVVEDLVHDDEHQNSSETIEYHICNDEGKVGMHIQNIAINDSTGLDIGSEQIVVESEAVIDQQPQQEESPRIYHRKRKLYEKRKVIVGEQPEHKEKEVSSISSSSKIAVYPSTSQNKPAQVSRESGHGLRDGYLRRLPNGRAEYVEEISYNKFLLDSCILEEELPTNVRLLLPQLFQTIQRLSDEVAYLRSQLKVQQSTEIHTQPDKNNYGTVRKAKKRGHNLVGRSGLHILNHHNRMVLLSELSNEDLKRTIEISRNDENRLVYGDADITEMVLEKIDLSANIHNPSLCGRMVADVLFSPEYLADKHILGEGQMSSRTRLETLPFEMTRLFYDSLRKLGVSRISEDDQEHWLYLARDGVNQRARDLKANRRRKFYIEEQPI